ncbi:uncharacterized protein upd3 [Drosophila kikkawai]|uniref:Uncharacterized protein upd3 n=1 Tax=Drosophila kikkawai TaxID=30033 RepID=A0A6P4J148_DROKI|nr:uncharacterized protein LOC108083379 [Drosophila kikkawai]
MTTADCPLDVSTTASAGNPTVPLPPPVERRHHTNRIWWLLTLTLVIMCELQQFAGGGGGGGGGSGVFGVAAAPTPTETSSVAKRLQKRHGHPPATFRERFQLELNASNAKLDWVNTCGGKWHARRTQNKRTSNVCKKRQMALQSLQNQTGRELRTLQAEDKSRNTTNSIREVGTGTNKAINISKLRKWEFHRQHYKFLPRLNDSSKQLNLRHVHRDLQFYVAAFSYLRHAKLHWDYVNLQAESAMSADLKRMRTTAGRVLCNVEMAINATAQRRQRQSFKVVPLALMEKRLQQFKTPLVQLHQQASLAARNEAVEPPPQSAKLPVDALFAKYEFVQYLKSVRRILARQRQQLKCRKKPEAAATKKPLQN